MNKKYSLKKSNDIEQLIKKHQSVGNKYYAIYYDKNALVSVGGDVLQLTLKLRNGIIIGEYYT